MRVNSERLTQSARNAGRFLNHAVLGIVWLVYLRLFVENMLPRLAYLTGNEPIHADWPCLTPECDFSVFWPAGLLARAHELNALYQPQAFAAAGAHLLVPGAGLETFYYPPQMLLPSMLISFLPFEAGFFVWTAAFILLAAWLLRRAGLSWVVIVAALLSPAAIWNFEVGQLGVISGALLAAGLLTAARQSWRGGLALGLLICKPQAAILVPVALAAGRNWAALAATSLLAAAITLLVQFFFGWHVWTLYLMDGLSQSAAVLDSPFIGHLSEGGGVSVFWLARSLHAGLAVANACQIGVSLAAAGLTFFAWRQDGVAPVERMALAVLFSLLATPYGYGDDMVAYSIALAALAQARGWRIDFYDTLFWLWPALCQVVSMETGVLLTPLVVAAAAARIWVRAGLPVPLWPGRAAVPAGAGNFGAQADRVT